MQPRETFQSLLAAAKQGTKRASDRASSPSERNGTSPDVLDSNSAASILRYDETTRTRTEDTETAIPVLNEDEARPSTPSVEGNSATPISQEDNLVELMRSFEENIKAFLLQMDKHAVDGNPPKQDNKATSSQAAQPPGLIEDNSACEHKVSCDSKCGR